jgi:hypothetical protein
MPKKKTTKKSPSARSARVQEQKVIINRNTRRMLDELERSNRPERPKR